MKEKLKKWWLEQYSIINVAFGVALSTIYVRCTILNYGIDFKIELPWCLNNLNPIYWLAKGIVFIVSKLTKNCFCCLFWKFGKNKGLELQLFPKYEIIAFEYCWNEHCDHWGHWTAATIAGLGWNASFADNRHWDDDKTTPYDSAETDR